MSVNGSARWRLVNVRTTEHQRNLRLERASHTATVVGSSVLIVGGRRGSNQFFADLLKFDTTSHTWTVVCPAIPNGFRARANHTATLVGGRQLWVVSGSDKENVLDDVHVLDVASMTWSKPQIRGDAALLKRTAHSADLHPTDPSTILLFGGYGHTSDAVDATFRNDLVLLRTASRTVERLVTIVGPLPGVVGAAGGGLVGVAPPLPRAYHSCTSLGGRLYVYGGRTDAAVLEERQQLAVFDAVAGAWVDPGHVEGPMPLGRSSHRAVALGNRLLIHGGAAAGDQADRLGDVLTLLVDPKTGALAWSRMDEPPPPATGSAAAAKPHGRSAHTISLVGNHQLFVIAGYVGSATGHSRYTSDVYLLQLGTPAVEPMPAMTLPARAQAAQGLPQNAPPGKRTPSPPGRRTVQAAQPQPAAHPAKKGQQQPSAAEGVTVPAVRGPPSPPRAASAMGDTGQSAGSRRTHAPPSPDGGRSASPNAPSAVSRLGTVAAGTAPPAAQPPAITGREGMAAAGGVGVAAAGGGGTGAYGSAQREDMIDLTADQAPAAAEAASGKSPARTPRRRGLKADAAAGPTMEGQWLGGGRRGRSGPSEAAVGQVQDEEAGAGARPAKRQATDEAGAAAGGGRTVAPSVAAAAPAAARAHRQQQPAGAPLQRASSASGAAVTGLRQPEQSLPHPLQQAQPHAHQHPHPLGHSHGARHGSAPPGIGGAGGGGAAAAGGGMHVTAAASARVSQQQPGGAGAGAAPAVGLTWQTQTELCGLPPGSGPDTATIAAAATAAATAAVAATTAAAAAGGQQPQAPVGGSAPAAYLHRPPSPSHQPQVQAYPPPPPHTVAHLGSNSQNDLLNGLLQQLQRAQEENAELRRQLQDSATLTADLALARRNADAALADRRANEQELAHAQSLLDAERTQAAALRQQLAAAQQAATAAAAQLADRERALRDAEAARQSEDRARQEERRIQEDRCRALEAQHQRSASELASLRSALREEQLRRGEELKERDRELSDLRTQLRTAASRNQDQESALRRAQDERQRSERELAEARDAHQQIQRQLNDTTTEFTRYREKAQAEQVQASARLANVEAELRRTKDDLTHKETQYAAVVKAHTEAVEEAKGLREQLRVITARLDAARQQCALLTTHQATIVSALQAAQGASGALDKALNGAAPALG
ncbi:hypothetical protein HYH02_012775 [Chlamydomonas schloesseri]|uniref:Attractin/MKLN-like beta-propeller domain-containing protein n=1 Tax=Chlamydomonas schloesseri TaxID=2026947 RepID=A0A835T7N1_9CHLO|nr:hypothetical protein HYH02_012775 [Chlamydomonas schloesseri]|eukprot:KAG2433071.1 hypothetical protein HYH02_012775 [Chlamydomonas schloesseri]